MRHRPFVTACERKGKKLLESPSDKAARRANMATVWMAIFTLVLTLVSGGTLFILHRQLKEMQNGGVDTHALAVAAGKQSDTSKALADLTAKQFAASHQLIESQRASITVAYSSVVAPVTFHDGGLSANFSVVLRNVGWIPATKVKIHYQPYFSRWGENIFSEPLLRQKNFCDKPDQSQEVVWSREGKRIDLKGLTGQNAMTILPGEKKEFQVNFGMGKPTNSDIIKWPPGQPNQTERVYPIVVGCVDYQSGVIPEKHRTGFIFEIQTIYSLGDGMPTMISFGTDVPRGKVVIIQYPFGQGEEY